MYIGALAFWQNADYTKGEKLKRTCGEEAAQMREICQTFGITALGETVESWTLENEFLTCLLYTSDAADD